MRSIHIFSLIQAGKHTCHAARHTELKFRTPDTHSRIQTKPKSRREDEDEDEDEVAEAQVYIYLSCTTSSMLCSICNRP